MLRFSEFVILLSNSGFHCRTGSTFWCRACSISDSMTVHMATTTTATIHYIFTHTTIHWTTFTASSFPWTRTFTSFFRWRSWWCWVFSREQFLMGCSSWNECILGDVIQSTGLGVDRCHRLCFHSWNTTVKAIILKLLHCIRVQKMWNDLWIL